MFYFELIFGIVVTTIVVNNFIHIAGVNPKWIALVIGVFGSVVHYFTHENSQIMALVGSFGVAMLLYIYIYQTIKSALKK